MANVSPDPTANAAGRIPVPLIRWQMTGEGAPAAQAVSAAARTGKEGSSAVP
jgi:hypothetical protein